MMQPFKNSVFFLLPFLLLSIFSTHRGDAAPIVTAGGLLKYLNQTEFATAFPSLSIENFEESPVEPGLSTNCIGPLDSTTDQSGCFAPGDILPGLSIDTDRSDGIIPVLGAGFDTLTTTSVTLSSTGNGSNLSISFTGSDVYAVGMDLAAYTAGGSTYTITVNGSTGTLDSIQLASVSTSGTFFGIYAPSKITQIILTNTENEVVDNIRFGGSASTLSFFTLQGVFQNAHSGLAVEDFEESRVTAGNISAVFAEPLDATTDNSYFSPGEISSGLQIKTVSTTDPSTSLWTLAAGEVHNTSKIVGSQRPADNLQIVFQNNETYAAGMNLLLEFAGNVATVIVYGPNGALAGLTQQNQSTPAETFFGVYAQQPISRIEILSPALEFIDNIRFGIGGRFPWPLFLPAITGHGKLTAP